MKSSEVSFKTKSTPASLTIQGQVTKDNCKMLYSLNLYNVGVVSRNWIDRNGVQGTKENEKFTVVCSRSPQNLKFGALSIQPKLSANGTEISWKSFQKFRKLLNFRNANHSTENFRNSGSKVGMERKLPGNFFRKFGYTSRGCPLFWKYRKIVITGAVNRKILFHSLLEVAGNPNRKFGLNGKRPWSFHVVVLQRMAKKCTKTYNARAERLVLFIKPIVLWRSRCRRRCLSSCEKESLKTECFHK